MIQPCSRRASGAVLALIAFVVFCPPMDAARAAETGLGPRVISVNGEGEVFAKPDTARFAAAVVTQGVTAEDASAANATAMNRVLDGLAQLGIPASKVQTSNFSIQPQYPPFRADAPAAPRTISGYQVTNQVTVTVDDLTKLAPALDLLVRNGANQIGGVFFSVADPKPLMQRARAAAVADAAAKARTLAGAAGVTLGPLLSIEEGPGLLRPVAPLALRTEAATAAPPIAAGEQPFVANVVLTYAIQ